MEKEQIKVGGRYRYRLHQSKTGELLVDCLVEVVKHLSDEACRFTVKEVYKDDSGNGYYTYIHRTGGEVNGSYKYLSKEVDNNG